MEKPAPVDHPILSLIRRRWSPRAFANRHVPPDMLLCLFEAARWAPSSYNEQPWRFLIGQKGRDQHYERILRALSDKNQRWARLAPVLVVGLAKTIFERNGRINPHARYDLGQAVAFLTLQAMEMGLFCHQMAGFSPEEIREAFNLSEHFDPVVVIAIGFPGEPTQLSAELQVSETAPRFRRPLGEIITFDVALREE